MPTHLNSFGGHVRISGNDHEYSFWFPVMSKKGAMLIEDTVKYELHSTCRYSRPPAR
jgi:fibrillarin-like rRNA methylase